MLKIGDVQLKSDVIVAPMAGIGNDAFRALCFEFGAGLLCSEMVSDKAIYYHNEKTMKMLEVNKDIHPVSLQLFGSDPETMVYAARILDEQTDCDIIDINMGCPVNKVIKSGSGSALMKDEELAVKIVKDIIANVRKPVTVKMRLGYDREHLNYLSLARKLEAAGVSAIALHARTRSQMYEGHADWPHIKILKDHLQIPVIGNGDVKSVDDFKRMKNETGCDAVMIGRALIGNPFLIRQIITDDPESSAYQVRFAYCLKHCEKLIALKGERIAMGEMRGIAPHYISGLYAATGYKARMNTMKTYAELKEILDDYGILLDEYYSSSS